MQKFERLPHAYCGSRHVSATLDDFKAVAHNEVTVWQ